MKNQLKIGAIITYINIFLSSLFGFITAPLMLEAFGDSEYGAYQIAVALVGYMTVLDLGLHNVTTRYVAKYHAQKQSEEQENFLAVNLILYGIVAGIVLVIGWILYMNIGNIFGAKNTPQEIALIRKLLCVLVLNMAVSMPGEVFSAVAVAYERFVFRKGMETLKILLRLILVIALLQLGEKAFAIVLMEMAVNVLEMLLGMWYCFFRLKIRIKLYRFNKAVVAPILTYSFFIFLIAITEQINWKVDTTILGIMTGTAAVTLYSVAGQLITLYRTFCRRISSIFLPRVTKMVALGADNHALTSVMIRVGRLQLMIVGLTWTGFFMIGQDFIEKWMGRSYIEAYYLFLIISVPLIIPMCQSIGIDILEAKNMNKFRSVVYFCIALCNVVVSCVLVHFIGLRGAAYGTAIALVMGEILAINWYYSQRVHLEMRRYYKEVFGSIMPIQILSGIVSWLLLRVFPARISWTNLIARAVLITAVYCVFIYCMAMNTDEKRQLRFRK